MDRIMAVIWNVNMTQAWGASPSSPPLQWHPLERLLCTSSLVRFSFYLLPFLSAASGARMHCHMKLGSLLKQEIIISTSFCLFPTTLLPTVW